MVELVHDRLFSAVVCSDINPEDPDAYDRLDKELLSLYNGTMSSPWQVIRKFPKGLEEQGKPGPCKETPGRWHYVVSINGTDFSGDRKEEASLGS